MRNEIKTAYIEGRPHGHPTHTSYAKSVDSVFHFVDFRLRFHDVVNSSRIRRYVSWILSAVSFPNRKKYNIFFSEEAYFMLGIMKKLGLISKKQKLIALMGSHTLYFIHTNQYSESTKRAFLKLFQIYDAFICIGPIQFKLIKKFLGESTSTKVYQIFNGTPQNKFEKLIKISPNLVKKNILTIGAIPNRSRIYYKGIDLMLQSFSIAKESFPTLTYTIIGEYKTAIMEELLEKYCPRFKSDVILKGHIDDIDSYMLETSIYLHIARGEAWGLSVTEAMTAGVPPIVSEWTGAKEAVSKISEELIVPLDANAVAAKIKWYFELSLEKKIELSTKCKQVAGFYTEENAIENFKSIFQNAYNELSHNTN